MPTGGELSSRGQLSEDAGQQPLQQPFPESGLLSPVDQALAVSEHVKASTYVNPFDTDEGNKGNRDLELRLAQELIERRRRAASQPPSIPQENH